MLGLPCRTGFHPVVVGGDAPWLRRGASRGGGVADCRLQAPRASVVVVPRLSRGGFWALRRRLSSSDELSEMLLFYLALSCLVTSRRGRPIPGIAPVSPALSAAPPGQP